MVTRRRCFSFVFEIFTWYDGRDELSVPDAVREPQMHELADDPADGGARFEHRNEAARRYWDGRRDYGEYELKTNADCHGSW